MEGFWALKRSVARRGGLADALVSCVGTAFPFGCTDIVAQGLRTIRTGERVRFLDRAPGYARYVIRLDLPDIGGYCQ